MGRSRTQMASLACLALAAAGPAVAVTESWPPIVPAELQMASEPQAPGAAAVFLYRQVDRDDNEPDEVVYARIKVLTEAGRKYADVEIPYLGAYESVRSIQARTIQPDGSSVEFDGQAFDKTIIKGRSFSYLAKTFALPGVRVGSIIEYRYRHILPPGYVFDSRWILSQELYTRLARFTLLPSREFSLTYTWPMGLPEGTEPPIMRAGRIRLEAHDVPAFLAEDDMPPEDELKYRVEFDYRGQGDIPSDPEVFWKDFGKQQFRTIDAFVDERNAMEQALAQIVQPGDSEELKLRKLYARCQQLRNLSYERDKTEQETRRENLKQVHDVAEVWKRGYGDATQVTWLFLALARAAGFSADPVLLSTRDRYLFDRRLLTPGKLNSNVVVVKRGERELYLDPGTPFTPFGLLPWYESGVPALRVGRNGGTWTATPRTAPEASTVEREAMLELSGGDLEGKLTVTYTGLEAMWRRASQQGQDETSRTRFLESDIQGSVPVGVNVKLRKPPDWESSAPNMVAEFDLEVPGWGEQAARRYLMPVGLFSGGEKDMFAHAQRVHPISFRFPYRHDDEVTITIPNGWHIESMPEAKSDDLHVMGYTMVTEGSGRVLQLTRTVTLDIGLAAPQAYGPIRDFFQRVRANDEEQIVVAPGPTPAKR